MKMLVGTSNLSQRPARARLRMAGEKLTRAMESKSAKPPEDPFDVRKALAVAKKKLAKENPCLREKPSSRTDPLASAKVTAASRDWKAHEKES